MEWSVEVSDSFCQWWPGLSDCEQDDVAATALLLSECGPYPRFPYSSWVNASRHRHMREIRIRSGGSPFRLVYAFDPKRVAIVLVGGAKGSRDRGYPYHIARIDSSYDAHLLELDLGGCPA